ncbi:MAG: membrane protein insertion efficiency factor YidD [Candidatus Peribacteraceae bacterium]
MSLFRKAFSVVFFLPARGLMGAVWLYRKTLSPDHGPLRHLFPYGFCRHHPTCSSYAMHQLRTKLLPDALASIAGRVARCTPWTKPSEERLREAVKKALK